MDYSPNPNQLPTSFIWLRAQPAVYPFPTYTQGGEKKTKLGHVGIILTSYLPLSFVGFFGCTGSSLQSVGSSLHHVSFSSCATQA